MCAAGVQDGDGLLCANFRADRAREVLAVLADPDGFPDDCPERPSRPQFASVCGMVKYSDRHQQYMSTIFPEKDIAKPTLTNPRFQMQGRKRVQNQWLLRFKKLSDCNRCW